MADYSYKPTQAFSQVLDLVANQRVKEQQIRESQQNVQSSQVNMIRGVAQDAASMVQGMVSSARTRSQEEAKKELATMLANGNTPTPAPGTLPPGSIGPNPQPIPMSQTPDFKAKQESLLMKAAPDVALKEMAQQIYSEKLLGGGANGLKAGTPPRSFESYLTSEVSAGRMTMQEAAQKLAEYKPHFYMDPSFGGPMTTPAYPGATPTPIAPPPVPAGGSGENNSLNNLRRAAPKIADKVEEIRQQAYPQNNTKLNDTVTAAASANTVREILNDPNPSQVGLASLGFHLARMSGSNSQLSDREREVFEQPLSFLAKIKNKGYRVVAGDLSPEMKADLNRLALTIEKKSKNQAAILINGARRQARGTAGGYWSKGLDDTFPKVDDLISFEKDTAAPQAGSAESDPMGLFK